MFVCQNCLLCCAEYQGNVLHYGKLYPEGYGRVGDRVGDARGAEGRECKGRIGVRGEVGRGGDAREG